MDLPTATCVPKRSTRSVLATQLQLLGAHRGTLWRCSLQRWHLSLLCSCDMHSQHCWASELPPPACPDPQMACVCLSSFLQGAVTFPKYGDTEPQGLTLLWFAARAAVGTRTHGDHSSWPSQKPHLELEKKTLVLSDQREAAAQPQLWSLNETLAVCDGEGGCFSISTGRTFLRGDPSLPSTPPLAFPISLSH